MTQDSRDKSAAKQPEPEGTDQRFGWHPDIPEPTRIEQKHADLDNDAQPTDFTGPSLIGETRPGSPSYWTPTRPGELPPTIIQRRPPPSAREMLGRYSKPAMMALTVAAVSSAGLAQSSQSALAQSSETSTGDETATGHLTESGEQQPAFQLDSESSEDGDQQPTTTSADRTGPIIYTVEQGDWVRHIARDFGLHTMTIVWNNDLPNPDYILPGQELLILPVDGVMVEVQAGESLNQLATTYGVTTTAIINYEPNGITNPDMIHPGQILIIPGGVPPQSSTQEASTPSNETASSDTAQQQAAPVVEQTESEATASFNGTGESITVNPGDTLASIAGDYGVSVDDLIQLNGLDDADSIFPGDVINLPAGVEAPQQTAPEPETQPETEPAPEPPPVPDPEPEPASAPDPVPPPQPDPTPTPAPEPTATPAPDPTPTPAPPPADTGPPSDIPGLLEYYANQYGLDPNLIKAVAWRESGWNQSAVSSAGAIGVMQVMPGTADWINNNLVSRNLNVRGSAADNIEAGTAYLAHRINQFGDVEHGLAAYFMGPATVQNHGITSTGRQYVNRVLEIRDYIAANGGPPSWR